MGAVSPGSSVPGELSCLILLALVFQYHYYMTTSADTHAPAVLTVSPGDPYDCTDIGDLAGDEQVAGESISIAELAALLRREILSGKHRAGSRFRTREKIAEEHNVSGESAGVALRMLASEGLVTMQQGRGTFVAGLRYYDVTITAGLPDGTEPPWQARVSADAMRTDPALTALEFRHLGVGRFWVWESIVQAADGARAAAAGLRAARGNAFGIGWDFAGASITVEPR